MLNYLIFLLLPSYLIRLSVVDSISINLLELLLLTAITINFYTLLKTSSVHRLLRQATKNASIFLPIILILAGFTLGYFGHQYSSDWLNWTDGFGKLLDLIILPIVYGLSLLALINFKKAFLLKLLMYYYWSAFSISLIGLFYFINHWLTFDERLTIFFQSPNELAIFISPAILVGLHLFLSPKKNHPRKFLFLLSILTLLFILYQTFSLGAWLGIMVSSLFLVLNTKNFAFKSCLKIIILIPIILISLSILNIDLLLNSINYQPKIPATSYDSRLTIYQVNQKIISTHWLYGIGINNYQSIYLAQQKYFPFYPQWAVPHAHNNLIHFWIEGGLLAGVGLFLLIYNILLPKNATPKPFQNSTIILIYSIFTYFVIHGLVDTTLWTPFAAILFFFLSTYLLYKQRR
jgi:O-antigen ligase